MKKNFSIFALAAAGALTAMLPAVAQPPRRNAPATNAAASAAQQGVLQWLPTSDAVVTVDVRRLLEALPRVLANDPAKLGRINDDINDFKAQTGLDPRSFERVVVGASFAQTASGATKIEPVAIAHGTFNSNALVAAARIAAATKGKAEEVKHRGKSIAVFSLNRQVSLLNLRFTELAVVALDQNTIAFGKTERVRAAIDAGADSGGGGRASSEVVALAMRDPQALVGMGGKLPAGLTEKIDLPSPELTRSIAAIRQFYGAVGVTDTRFNVNTVFRTETAGAARSLGDTVEGLKQLAPALISMQMSGERARLARGAVESTKVGVSGNEVQIIIDLTQEDFSALLRAF